MGVGSQLYMQVNVGVGVWSKTSWQVADLAVLNIKFGYIQLWATNHCFTGYYKMNCIVGAFIIPDLKQGIWSSSSKILSLRRSDTKILILLSGRSDLELKITVLKKVWRLGGSRWPVITLTYVRHFLFLAAHCLYYLIQKGGMQLLHAETATLLPAFFGTSSSVDRCLAVGSPEEGSNMNVKWQSSMKKICGFGNTP